jgi:hypothetical protein
MRGALSNDIIERSIAKLEKFRALKISPDQVVVTDKIFFPDAPTRSTQTGMAGMYDLPIRSSLNFLIICLGEI